MNNPEKMTAEAVQLITKISNWCLKNSNEHFTCFFTYDAHIANAEVSVFTNGWKGYQNDGYAFNFYLAGRNHNVETLREQVSYRLTELKEMKKTSNKKHKINNT
jgi:hypothetical protein